MASQIEVAFQGWFQCRLATNPDPYDEPRGVSGWTFATVDEPDLDRTIRFRNPMVPRFAGPTIGVAVSGVRVGGAPVPGHPLLAAAVDLLEHPVFEGRDGVVAGDANEPISPFHISLATNGGLVLRCRDADIDVLHPSTIGRRRPIGLATNSAEVAAATGIANRRVFRLNRRAGLAAQLAATVDPLARSAFQFRIDQIDESVAAGGDIREASLGFKLTYDHPIAGPAVVVDPANQLGGVIDAAAPWRIRFWCGGWDADALSGFTQGTLIIPTL